MTTIELIRKLGLRPDLHGFNYLIRALELAKDYDQKDMLITKDIYPVIAREYGKKPGAIERSISRAIERIDPIKLNFYFEGSFVKNKRPSAKQFVAMIARYN